MTKNFFRCFISNMMDNSVSFTSRIHFVDRKLFENFRRGAYVDFRAQNEFSALDMINIKKAEKEMCGKIKSPRLDVLKADEFYTEDVRTCTAGGVIDTKTGEAVGFHFYDSIDNAEKTGDMLENIFARVPNPDRALILGSKNLKSSIYSIQIFKDIYDGIAKRVPNVTIFREHVFPFSESHLHYSAKEDTWTIQSMYRPLTDYREFDVTSRDLLDKSFKEIKLADGDVIEFIG